MPRLLSPSTLQPPYVLEAVTGRQQADSHRHWEGPLLPLRGWSEAGRAVGREAEGDPVGPRTQGSSDADSDSRGTRASAGDGDGDGAEPSRAEPPPAPSARHLPPGGPGNIAEGLWRLSRRFSRNHARYYAILRRELALQ